MTDDYHHQLRRRVERAERAEIDIIHARAQWFLWNQRHRRHNANWFTLADVAADLGQRPPIISFIVAMKELAETGAIVADAAGRVRHV